MWLYRVQLRTKGSKASSKRTQHCWRLHVASVCTPCCILLRVVGSCCIRLNTTATRTQQHAKLLAQQCCELLRPFTSSLRTRGKRWILMWPVKLKTVIAWTNCDAKIFKDSLALVPWRVCSVFDIEDNCWLAESLYKDFSSEFLKTRKAKVRGKPLPWMNSKIRKIMNKRYELLVKAQASHNADDWNNCRRLRNQVRKEMNIAEANYWSLIN